MHARHLLLWYNVYGLTNALMVIYQIPLAKLQKLAQAFPEEWRYSN